MLEPDELKKIDAAKSAVVASILAADADAYAKCYTPDGILMHPDTPYVKGHEALRRYAQQVFDAVRVTKLVNTAVLVAGSGDFAYEIGTQEIHIDPPDDKFKPQRQYLLVYRRQPDGTWKVAAGMSANV